MTADHRAPRPPAARPLLGLVTAQALAVGALALAATRAPVAGAPWWAGAPRWLATAPPADALAVAAHRVALLIASWTLLTTVAHLAAALTRVPALVRGTAWLALPAARRAVAALVVTAGVLAPATAGAADDPGPVRSGRSSTTTTTRTTGTTTTITDTTSGTTTAGPVTTTAAATPGATALPAGTVVVQPGDSLWGIAAAVVAAEEARPVADVPAAEVAPRWALIRDANAPRLRSGDPSLIYPGEEVVVPE
jgi:hypothetical protein